MSRAKISFALLILIWPGAFSQVDENVFRKVTDKGARTSVNEDLVKEKQLNFNSDWCFHLGELPGFFAPEFDDAAWRVLDVPHDWSVEGQFAEANQTGASGGGICQSGSAVTASILFCRRAQKGEGGLRGYFQQLSGECEY